MKRPASLTILGGAREIGANSYYLEMGGTGLLLDAGLHPRLHGADALPDLDAVDGDVDAILISHAHLDHVGALPVALRRFPRSRVYMSGPTSVLARRMLRNAVAVARHLSPAMSQPLFSHEEVDWLERVIRPCEMAANIPLDLTPGQQPRLTLYNAGHLLGAAGILIEDSGRRFFYTGDTCAHPQFICQGATYPRGPLDLLLLDSTHGADADPQLQRDQHAFSRAIEELAAFTREVARRGGSVLIPVFAMGRSQEIQGVLHDLMIRGEIPALPLFVSGLAHSVCRIYDDVRMESHRRRKELVLKDTDYRVIQPDRIHDPGLLERPVILAVTSGMMFPNTSSHTLAARMVGDPKNGVAFVGYLDPQSPGFALATASPGETVRLGPGAGAVRVACPVRQFSFTAHSRLSQLVQTVRELQPAHVVLVHGESAAVEGLAGRLREVAGKVTVAEPRQRIHF